MIADERGFAEELRKQWQIQADSKPQFYKEERQKIKHRLEELDRLVKQLSETEGITEALKAENQALWIQTMNNLRNTATEIVLSELIYC